MDFIFCLETIDFSQKIVIKENVGSKILQENRIKSFKGYPLLIAAHKLTAKTFSTDRKVGDQISFRQNIRQTIKTVTQNKPQNIPRKISIDKIPDSQI